MALYHLSAKIISRSHGRSATGAAAYRSASVIEDQRTGQVHDYQRKRGVDFSALLTPDHAPDWARDRARLWNAVEQAEIRRDAQLAREVEVALPRELTPWQMQALVTTFARAQFVSRGMVADIALHHAQGDNPHAHLLLTTRTLTADGFGPKCREWNRKDHLEAWRAAWAQYANQALAQAAVEARIDHRSLTAQGIERLPQIHLGPKVLALESQGIETERGQQALAIEARNAQLQDLIQHREAITHECHRETESRPQHPGAGARDRTPGASPGEPSRRHPAELAGDPRSGGAHGSEQPESATARAGTSREQPRPAQPSRQPLAEPVPRSPLPQPEPDLANRGDRALDRQLERPAVSDSYDRIVALATTVDRASPAGPTDGRADPVHLPTGPQSLRQHPESRERPVDRTTLAVRRQLDALRCAHYEVGIRRREGQMLIRTWSRLETLAAVPWLKRENAQGADIYLRPAGARNQGLVLLDDLNQAQLAQLQRDGLTPAAVVETSPYNFQAWVRLSEQPLAPAVATAAAQALAHTYGADLNSADWRHFGRLAGFTNRKPEHTTETGLNPYVLAHAAGGKLALRGADVVAVATEGVRQAELKADLNHRLDALKTPLEGAQRGDPLGDYRVGLKRLLDRHGDGLDLSRADWAVCKAMAKAGHSAQNLTRALTEASPELPRRKLGHERDYVERTVAKVMALPEVRDAQARLIQAARLRHQLSYDQGLELGD